jgi:hypothetical protein
VKVPFGGYTGVGVDDGRIVGAGGIAVGVGAAVGALEGLVTGVPPGGGRLGWLFGAPPSGPGTRPPPLLHAASVAKNIKTKAKRTKALFRLPVSPQRLRVNERCALKPVEKLRGR